MVARIVAILLLGLGATQVKAAGIDLRLSDESGELFYLYQTATFGYGGADVGIGVFFNDYDDLMASFSWTVSGSGVGNARALQYGVSIKAYGAMIEQRNQSDLSGGALGLGGLIRYVIPSATPVAFLAEGYMAPKVTSFGDADGFTEFRVAGEVEITPSAKAYVGFRHLEMEPANGTQEIEMDDNVHIGVRLSF